MLLPVDLDLTVISALLPVDLDLTVPKCPVTGIFRSDCDQCPVTGRLKPDCSSVLLILTVDLNPFSVAIAVIILVILTLMTLMLQSPVRVERMLNQNGSVTEVQYSKRT